MLELKDVSVGYGSTNIISSATFCAQPGITVILGKNGSGKSTLLRAMSGIIRYGGSIRVDGHEVETLAPKRRASLVSVMPQLKKSPDVTLYELVSFGRQPHTGFSGILSKDDREIVQRVIAEVGLTDLADRLVPTLSGGERQKAYLAMMLAQDAPNMLLDEPDAFLDPEYRGVLCSFLKDCAKRGRTVVAVLHDINRALSLADKIVAVTNDGLFDGSPNDFIESGLAEGLFSLRRYEGVGKDGGSFILFN